MALLEHKFFVLNLIQLRLWNFAQRDGNISLNFSGIISIAKLHHLLKTQPEYFSFGFSNKSLDVSSIKTLKLDQINH